MGKVSSFLLATGVACGIAAAAATASSATTATYTQVPTTGTIVEGPGNTTYQYAPENTYSPAPTYSPTPTPAYSPTPTHEPTHSATTPVPTHVTHPDQTLANTGTQPEPMLTLAVILLSLGVIQVAISRLLKTH